MMPMYLAANTFDDGSGNLDTTPLYTFVPSSTDTFSLLSAFFLSVPRASLFFDINAVPFPDRSFVLASTYDFYLFQ